MDKDNEIKFSLNIVPDDRDIFQQLADIGRGGPRKKTWSERLKENCHKRICNELAEEYNRIEERDAERKQMLLEGHITYDEILKEDIKNDKTVQEVRAIVQAYQDAADMQKYKDLARIGLGEVVAGSSFHPILNVPYIGTGLGGALYETGMGIMEGNTLPEK